MGEEKEVDREIDGSKEFNVLCHRKIYKMLIDKTQADDNLAP